MWPTSAATPHLPRTSSRSTTIAPPSPVPTVSMSMSVASRATPNWNSAQPAAFASFSTTIGTSTSPMSSRTLRASGYSRHAMFGAKSTEVRSGLTKPAAARPIAPTSWSAVSSA
ncbi:Uncharacterised protein [Mycobacteroides abscessus]|nr:Uncharacterised protein [Mycobacteroides abscessus]